MDILSPDRDLFGVAVTLIAVALASVLAFLAWRFARAYRADSESATVERLMCAASTLRVHEPAPALSEMDAVAWLQGECRRLGISMPAQRARAWVNAMRPDATALSDEPPLPAQMQPFIIKPLEPAELADGSTAERLAALACGAVQFLDQLKQKGPLSVRRGDASLDVDVETDIAAAWLLTEVASRGLTVSTDEVGQALMAAFEDRPSLPQLPSTPTRAGQ